MRTEAKTATAETVVTALAIAAGVETIAARAAAATVIEPSWWADHLAPLKPPFEMAPGLSPDWH